MAKTIINTKEQERKARAIYVKKVMRFAKSKAGLRIIRKLAPQIAKKIEDNPEFLDLYQWREDPLVAGNYFVKFFEKIGYTGQSGNCVFRLTEHIYNYCSGADAFGHKYDSKDMFPVKFEVYAWGVEHKEMRELIEENVIKVMHPFLQWTDPNAPDYGIDKPIPDGETRESMRPDICIFTNLKIDRFKHLQGEYNKNVVKQLN